MHAIKNDIVVQLHFYVSHSQIYVCCFCPFIDKIEEHSRHTKTIFSVFAIKKMRPPYLSDWVLLIIHREKMVGSNVFPIKLPFGIN